MCMCLKREQTTKRVTFTVRLMFPVSWSSKSWTECSLEDNIADDLQDNSCVTSDGNYNGLGHRECV